MAQSVRRGHEPARPAPLQVSSVDVRARQGFPAGGYAGLDNPSSMRARTATDTPGTYVFHMDTPNVDEIVCAAITASAAGDPALAIGTLRTIERHDLRVALALAVGVAGTVTCEFAKETSKETSAILGPFFAAIAAEPWEDDEDGSWQALFGDEIQDEE